MFKSSCVVSRVGIVPGWAHASGIQLQGDRAMRTGQRLGIWSGLQISHQAIDELGRGDFG